jgi:hypothetical protein
LITVGAGQFMLVDSAGASPDVTAAEQHQRQHAPGKAAQGRGEQEQPCASEKDAFTAVDIGEAPSSASSSRLARRLFALVRCRDEACARFATDSPVEGEGFEPSVPVKKNPPVETII